MKSQMGSAGTPRGRCQQRVHGSELTQRERDVSHDGEPESVWGRSRPRDTKVGSLAQDFLWLFANMQQKGKV